MAIKIYFDMSVKHFLFLFQFSFHIGTVRKNISQGYGHEAYINHQRYCSALILQLAFLFFHESFQKDPDM